MKKSKHFRKDVILARIIAAVILIVLIALICFGVSLLTKPSGSDKDSQNTQNTQNELPETQSTENVENTENVNNTENVINTENVEDTEQQAGIEGQPSVDEKIYVKTTTQVKLRKEPNTNCATLDRIDGGTKLEVLETLDGWYKVIYDGKEGYVSATYAKIVEE